MRIPKMSRHATGQARVRIAGRDHYLGLYGSPEAEARYKQLIAGMLAGQPVTSRDVSPTINFVIASFLEHVQRTQRPDGRKHARYRAAVQPLRDLYGHEPAAAFSPKKLKALQAHMAGPCGWNRSTCNMRLHLLRSLFRWAESEELAPAGLTHALATVEQLPRSYPGIKLTPAREPSTREEVMRVADHVRARSPAVAAMLELQWVTGMRSQEVRTMRTQDIDRTRGDIWLYRPERFKTDYIEDTAPRVIALSAEAQALILPWLRETDPAAYIFPSGQGPCYTASSYARCVRHACQRLRMKILPYCGRHAFKERVTRELGEDAARAALGHTSVQTTRKYARRQDIEATIDVARKLG